MFFLLRFFVDSPRILWTIETLYLLFVTKAKETVASASNEMAREDIKPIPLYIFVVVTNVCADMKKVDITARMIFVDIASCERKSTPDMHDSHLAQSWP